MKQASLLNLLRALGLTLVAFAGNQAMAQVTPDAGRLLNDPSRRGADTLRHPEPFVADPASPFAPALAADDTVRVQVNAIRFVQNTVVPDGQLQEVVRAYLGKDLSLGDLRKACDRVTEYYRDNGYFLARAYLAAQDIKGGVVQITVMEGQYGQIVAEKSAAARVSDGLIAALIKSHSGDVIRSDALERSLLLINDLPGVSAKALLAPGKTSGTSDLKIVMDEKPVLNGLLDADNFGSRFTGAGRVGAEVNFSDPAGQGDLATLRLQKSSNLELFRGGYQWPLGHDGFRLGVNGSSLRYSLCCDFSALNASGRAGEYAIVASYPLVRSRKWNVNFSSNLTHRDMYNQANAVTTSDKSINSATFGINGDYAADGSMAIWSLGLSEGYADLSGWAADKAADSLAAQVHGAYSKLVYAFQYERALSSHWAIRLALSGQFTNKNLDSSEQIGLGGPFAVRAYPVGEALGDEGHVLNMEAKWQLSESLEGIAYFDKGWSKLHKSPWTNWQAGNSSLPNTFGLSDIGAGLTWHFRKGSAVRLLWAHKLDGNPGASGSGKDSDGQALGDRFWMQLSMQF